jgi:hypothetical protein
MGHNAVTSSWRCCHSLLSLACCYLRHFVDVEIRDSLHVLVCERRIDGDGTRTLEHADFRNYHRVN